MIILASKSPRRKMLMSQITDSFSIYDSNIDEDKSLNLPYLEAVKDIAYRKALKAQEVYPNDLIIAADTIVVINNQILGKPKNIDDAYYMLNLLSDKTHEVVTSYTIIYKEEVISKNVISRVTFNKLNDELITSYIKSGSPLDKAGSYGIQDNDQFPIIKEYKGSLNNIIGFPVEDIKIDVNYLLKQ